MDVFELRDQLITDYRSFTSSAVEPRDRRIQDHLRRLLDSGDQWPEPWLSLNPAFATGGMISELVAQGILHPECERIFRVKLGSSDPGSATITLHRHQTEAVEAAAGGHSYVLTTGTGSGKSLAYIVPIVDRVLRLRDQGQQHSGVKAIVVYPMNALANSQLEELRKFLAFGYPEGKPAVRFERYTGQESEDKRREILADPPDILLTNYVMLELVLTRPDERRHLIQAANGLQFLVLDELHTYRGRQGADVAMLVRRLRDACGAPSIQVVGTSATMATDGTHAQQRAAVAEVASRLFGTEVSPRHVIGETLTRATPHQGRDQSSLRDSVLRAAGFGALGYADLAAEPLSAWVEVTFGLDDAGAAKDWVRRPPTTVPAAAHELANETGVDAAAAAEAIKHCLLAGSRTVNPVTGRPLFAFRVHQFLSKGDTVYVSVEPEASRHITSHYQLRVPGHPDKVLLPLGFCRECGQEYLIVSRQSRNGDLAYVPRQDADSSGGDSVTGYLYLSEDLPWTDDYIIEGRLPDHWIGEDREVLPTKRKYLPEEVWIRADGTQVDRGDGQRAWFISTPFAFCLRCRVAYEQIRGNDYAKLATLDREGRSSAVTVVSAAIVRAMKQFDDAEVEEAARKLLTFVDNRQDASLQAGHFNDFAQVTQLRGALFQAMQRHPEGLTHEVVAQQVAQALGLEPAEYAANPQARFSARELAAKTLRGVLEYRIYTDLQRGWRITMPNLEQTGLLRVRYVDLEEIAGDQALWAGVPFLGDAPPGVRHELAEITLDELRRVLAVDVDCLTDLGYERLQRDSRQHLTGLWALPEGERPPPIGTAYARQGAKGGSRSDLFLSGRGALGRYLRRPTSGLSGVVTTDDAQRVIRDLCRVLCDEGGLLTEVGELDGQPGYRLKASAIRWVAGDGTQGAEDRLRRAFTTDAAPRVNPFFKALYSEVAQSLRGLFAREHTAQVPADVRQERERSFRDGTLPLLYCSPTMELGVDIATLSAVSMRNVPPTPANYAQRSGRAGRSGQPALVVTYCATGNAHDTYYFRRSRDMVAGSVSPPRLDLANEDLVRSHVFAIWLAESGVSLRSRIPDLLEAEGDAPSLRVHPEIWRALTEPDVARRAVTRAERVIGDVRRTWDDSTQVTWWYDGWVADQVKGAATALDAALDRWRTLFRTAKAEYDAQNRLAIDTRASSRDKKQAAARASEARHQLNLLANEDPDRGQSDFYSYRYFASEGFLPGYSFPRLPLAAYVPGERPRGAEGDYIQRPRFVAIREFGPGALIYHEGARYEVTRVQLSRTAESSTAETEEARRCTSCGYHHAVSAGTDVCEFCGAELGLRTYGLLRLQTVFTRRRERISSDEEERRRAGFELEVSYRFQDRDDRAGHVDAVASDGAGRPVLELVYGDSAIIRIANVGLRRRKDKQDHGYWLDLVGGRWLAKKDVDTPVDQESLADWEQAQAPKLVIPYVEDRRNVLVVRLPVPADDVTRTTLQYALERGIEAVFQLEDSELESQRLPDLHNRGRMLLTEAAEGGAGALRRLVAEPQALARVARAALEIIHYDPATGVDLGHAEGASERCELGCYDCLLSYYNQVDHSGIDRHRVAELLQAMMRSSVAAGAAGKSRAEQRRILEDFTDSTLERELLDWLDERGYRLPDRAQVSVPEARARPDFVFDLPTGRAALFVDGPVHDGPRQSERDESADERLRDLGWAVVRLRYDDDWGTVVQRYPSVFGSGRAN